jgi:uncharacterized protein (DUF2235 family)
MKRIVICADGTWNVRDQLDKKTGRRRPTNVTKVARAVIAQANGIDQIVVYHDGIGTGRGLDRFTGGAFGDGIEQNIRELYRSIAYNYVDEDELYLFGFSRGAFTVRSLVGFMNAVGLLCKRDDYWVPELYGCYQDGKRPGSPEWDKVMHGLEAKVRPCPPIRFVGVWDTVGALGAPGFLGQVFNRKKYAYHDVSLNSHVEHAYQALAIDEHRRPFAPSVWDRRADWVGVLEQAWFAGAHSDVGGSESRDGLANQALHWMVEKAEALGLEFDKDYLKFFVPCFDGDLHDSMTPMYLAMIPITRPIGVHGLDERPHQAALDRHADKNSAYKPANLLDYLKRNPSPIPYNNQLPSRTPCANKS